MTNEVQQAKRPVSAALAGPYGHPFHPMLVTVPIGAWVAALVFDIASRFVAEPGFLAQGALWLIGRGRAMLGLALIVLAKVIGTGLVARLFMLTRPQLMRLPWFARVYTRWVGWKDGVMARVRASLPWRLARSLRRRWRIALRRG